MAEGFHLEDDEKTLAQVLDLAKSSKNKAIAANGSLPSDFENYLSQVVRYATGEDRNWDEPETLLERAVQAWEASKIRKVGDHIISLRTQTSDDWRAKRLVLDIITTDQPFLVDSISAALSDSGKPVSFFVNAVVNTARDANGLRTTQNGTLVNESLIHAEMDPAIDDAELAALEDTITKVLDDVAIAVEDWEPMRARLGACIAQLERATPTGVDREDQREAVDFLKWLWDNRFAFLGVRHYEYSNKDGKLEFQRDPENDLGILRDEARRVLKSTYSEAGHLSPAVEDFMQSGEPILVAKANAKSLVHRRVYMDYIGVKSYAPSGDVIGEDRFVGLLTSEAYNRPASDIPLLRAKVKKVIDEAKFTPGGHNENAILNILETFPRDEMFQMEVRELTDISLGILRLYKRPRVKLFIRRDRFDRFISALVFIPRDRFKSDVRESIGSYLAQTFNGRVSAFYPSFGDAALIRVHFIIGIDAGAPEGPGLTEMTRAIRTLCLEWNDGLLEAIRCGDERTASQLFGRYEKAFDAAYREKTLPIDALQDISVIEKLTTKSLQPRAFRNPQDKPEEIRIKLYTSLGPMKLSRLIPTLENLGLHVVQEDGHSVSVKTSDGHIGYWIHDFFTEEKNGRSIDVDGVGGLIEDAISGILSGLTEDDSFNALVIAAGLTWREAWLMRAAARHHQQAGFQFSQQYIAEALAKHPDIVRNLIGVFHARFNPAGPKIADQREKEVQQAEEKVVAALDTVTSLDEDRIIRRYLTLFAAITRTNFYQQTENNTAKPYISFKIDSHKIAELPEPKPYREIFVSSPRVDGVHLRFGPVARGGLRWSDRREDFRTEVLGLVKAQRVKNAVIVPTGSKGGFYPKHLPNDGDRAAIYEEGREAYKVFIRAMLDLTDNIVDGKVVSPPALVRWDDQDPYLVVAADKGTAQFSDTANAISEEYKFWLGDAFASGGSAGYDHKVMGITARGAWEATKRHFRELGKDIQTEPFTAAGVGDMSGDVFGNGMLLSEKTKLVAAFDHRDIFIDPDPDPAVSFAERKRLFETPRTSWQDYDKNLITKGGGVFSRSEKSIALSPETKALLNFDQDKAAPSELIKAILRANVELFWLGGIGTYFKAKDEESWEVGDRANDLVRINAEDMNMNVIGEGANLGLTQAARIAFAQKGGCINTDAIDNSAGVDSSDHEVNIKILLSVAIEKGELKQEDRDDLLGSMTEDVAQHVLVHNYEQTRAISQMQATAVADLDAHARLMNAMEHAGRLDRVIEGLPDQEEITLLRGKKAGLTRPELSVLLAYAKNWLFEELMESPAPDDPALERELFAYFPEPLHTYNSALVKHRLRREIIATRLANEIVDTCGPSFPYRTVEATGVRFSDIALSYEAARRVLNLNTYAQEVNSLDNKVDAGIQINLYNVASNLLREQMYRIASGAKTSAILDQRGVDGLIKEFTEAIASLKKSMPDILPQRAAALMTKRRQDWCDQGVPKKLAQKAALMPALELVFDVAIVAKETGWAVENAGAVFFATGEMLKIDTARVAAKKTPPSDYYDKLAVRRLSEDLAVRQTMLTKNFIRHAGAAPDTLDAKWFEDQFKVWREIDRIGFERYERFFAELEVKTGMTVSKMSLLNRKLVDLEDRLHTA